jgi:hypothetical protein
MRAEDLKPGMIIKYKSGCFKDMVCKVTKINIATYAIAGFEDEVLINNNKELGFPVGHKSYTSYRLANSDGFIVLNDLNEKSHLPEWL